MLREINFDQHWHMQALAGEPEAVKRLAESALTPLYSFCFCRVGRNHDLCEEVVQETLLRAIEELENYNPGRATNDIFPWLTGLARNEIRRVLAREKSTVSLEALWSRMDNELQTVYARLDSDVFSDDCLKREETRDLVNATMSQLPSHYRETLEAKYLCGRSVHDIAEIRKISEKSVESLLTRAREAFRATFLVLTRNLENGQSLRRVPAPDKGTNY